MKSKSLFAILAVAAALAFVAPLQAQERIGQAAVTQGTNATTAVTINKPSGVITTVALTNAAGISTSFTVNNSDVEAGSQVAANVQGYSGTVTTNGIPYAWVDTVAAGSFVVRVTNLGAANALAGTVKIGFRVNN